MHSLPPCAHACTGGLSRVSSLMVFSRAFPAFRIEKLTSHRVSRLTLREPNRFSAVSALCATCPIHEGFHLGSLSQHSIPCSVLQSQAEKSFSATFLLY